MKKIFYPIYIFIAITHAACGGSSGDNQSLVDYTKVYEELQKDNSYCSEVGINDRAELTLLCTKYGSNGEYLSKHIFLVAKNESKKEIPLPRAVSQQEFVSMSPVRNNGMFNLQISAPLLIDNQSEISTIPADQGVSYIWRNNRYDQYQASVTAISDSGEYCAALSSTTFDPSTKQYLISTKDLVELDSKGGIFTNMYPVAVSNNAVQYGYGNASDGGSQLISWSRDGQSILNRANVDPFSDSIIDVNNKNTILYAGSKTTADESFEQSYYIAKSDGTFVNIPNASGQSNYFNINDNNVVIGNSYDFSTGVITYHVFSEKRGLRPLREVVSLSEGEDINFVIALNNNNELLAAVSSDAGTRTVLLHLSDV